MEQLERSALGLLSPCSHCLTVEEVVFRYLANTDWLSLIRSRIFLICSEDNLSTGGKHSASNSRMVVASIMPASYNPFAISCATFSMNYFSAFFSVFMQSSLSILHDQLNKQAVPLLCSVGQEATPKRPHKSARRICGGALVGG